MFLGLRGIGRWLEFTCDWNVCDVVHGFATNTRNQASMVWDWQERGSYLLVFILIK